ncbi:MAG TPA: hypothetical protein VLL52_22160 [Anaerolineae bacterium]|nr:hypothetical protein [Anaerolineae bacterium]
MELKQYLRIFQRRWLLFITPVVIVLIASLATYQAPGTTYNVGVRFIVGQPPAPAAQDNDEARYYNWLASEYIVNALADWVRGGQFAAAVTAELDSQGLSIPAGAIQGGIAADNTRSMLLISLTHPDSAQLEAMMNAIITVMQRDNHTALPQLGDQPATLTPLDPLIINPISSGLRQQLDIPLRLAVALGVGFGLALLIEYFDPKIYDRHTLPPLDAPLLAEIPHPPKPLWRRLINL